MDKYNMKKAVVTFPITTGKKKRLITTYRGTELGIQLKSKHRSDLKILEQKYILNNGIAYAYLKEHSIKSLVNRHIDNCYFYQFDISNFFGSIDHQILLDKLSYTDSQWNEQLVFEASNRKHIGLSLGLIPSPYLSNIYLNDFDQRFNQLLLQLSPHIIYTRYSDDLTISSPKELDIELLTAELSSLLEQLNLKINEAKTKYTHLSCKGQHLKILGLNIIRGASTNYITVGRKFKSEAHYERDFLRKQAMNAYIRYNED